MRRSQRATSTFSSITIRTAGLTLSILWASKYLEEELKIAVDVTTRDGLHPMLKAEIERTAVQDRPTPA